MNRIVPDKESLTVEFKSDLKPVSDDVIIDCVVAFANTEGGDLYLGVEDDGSISGIHPLHRDITRLAAFIAYSGTQITANQTFHLQGGYRRGNGG